MRVRLPIIGLTLTNEPNPVIGEVVSAAAQTDRSKLSDKGKGMVDTLGLAFDFPSTTLSNEKEVSTKLLDANKEWVYRNNDVIAMEVSKINFQLYSVGLSNGEIVFNEVMSHPLLDLLDKPNMETTKSDAIYIIQSHKKLTGDAFWLKIRNGRKVVGLRQLPPDKIRLNLQQPTAEDPTVILNFEYKDVINGEKVHAIYDPKDIIHFKKPNPSNPFRGLGAVEPLAETIDVDTLTNYTTKSFFKKGAITNFVLSTEQKLNDQQLRRFEAQLKSIYGGGARNAYKTMILGGGLKPQKLTFSNKDMEFLDQLAWYRDKIMVGFGNTPASLGIIEDVNRANAEATLISWKRNTVKPDMDAIVNTLNEFLVGEFGANLILAYEDPIPEDRSDDLTEATQLYPQGIIMLNEARELLGYEPVTGGDSFRVSMNSFDTPGSVDDNGNQASDEEADNIEDDGESSKRLGHKSPLYKKKKQSGTPAALAHMDVKALLRSRGVYFKQRLNKELKNIVRPIAKELVLNGKAKHNRNRTVVKSEVTEVENEYQPPAHTRFTAEEIMGYYQKQLHSVEAVEEHFETAINKYLEFVKNKFLDNLATEVESKKDITKLTIHKDFFDDQEEELITQAAVDFNPLLENLAVISGQRALDLVTEDDVYLVSEQMRRRVANNVERFTRSMLDTDREHLTNIISDGIANGQSILEIRNAITADLDQYNKMQAQRIGRTEVLRASNQSALDAWQQSGVVEGKQWITAGATDECADYEGKIEMLSGNFYSDTDEFADGDPPLHPNCKCTLIPILVDEKSYINFDSKSQDMMRQKIKELEAQVDKRTKAFRDLKKLHAEDQAYIKGLENLVDD